MNYYEKNPCLAYMYVIHEDELVSSSLILVIINYVQNNKKKAKPKDRFFGLAFSSDFGYY